MEGTVVGMEKPKQGLSERLEEFQIYNEATCEYNGTPSVCLEAATAIRELLDGFKRIKDCGPLTKKEYAILDKNGVTHQEAIALALIAKYEPKP